MDKWNKDSGGCDIRAIILTGFGKNFCLISHWNQVSMGIHVKLGIDTQFIPAVISIMGGIRLHAF